MSAAIYTGLLYGIIAASGVIGFVLTLSLLYALIELIAWATGRHQKYFKDLD